MLKHIFKIKNIKLRNTLLKHFYRFNDNDFILLGLLETTLLARKKDYTYNQWYDKIINLIPQLKYEINTILPKFWTFTGSVEQYMAIYIELKSNKS